MVQFNGIIQWHNSMTQFNDTIEWHNWMTQLNDTIESHNCMIKLLFIIFFYEIEINKVYMNINYLYFFKRMKYIKYIWLQNE